MKQDDFDALWNPGATPACPMGMKLLRIWAEATPGAVEFVSITKLELLGRLPVSDKNKWRAFIEHRSQCEVCAEKRRTSH